RFFRLARIVPSTNVRGLSCALRAAVSAARKASPASGSGDTRATAILADRGVHLPLPLLARLLEVTVLAEIRQDSGLFALLLEPLERPLEALVIVDDDLWHSSYHPSRANRRKVSRIENLAGVEGGSKKVESLALPVRLALASSLTRAAT